MALTKIRIGDYFELFSKSCNITDLTCWDVSGVNREKEFFEPSTQVGTDTSKYKIVPPQYFACNLMHVGRDKVLPIAFNHTQKNKIVSPAYFVFKIKSNKILLQEYFFIMLKSVERDRYFWFHTDGSVRDGMAWEDFCDLEILVPSIEIQQKYVNIYNAMAANQKAYEKGLDDLKLVCDTKLDEIKHSSAYISVDKLVQEIDVRNTDGKIKNIKGINIFKNFMPSVASVEQENLRAYKLVQRGQFAFSGMQTGRDLCIRIALHKGDEPIIISPAYAVLEMSNKDMLAEFFMLWFSRNEIDRYGWFVSDGSIRANLDMDRFYEMQIPIPDIKIQQSIVDIYNQYITRKEINEKLKAQIKDLCPILIKGSLQGA